MGLLQHIEGGSFSEPSSTSQVKGSLLQKMLKYADSKLSFFEFTEKHNLSLCAVFEKCENTFVISASKGIDSLSILNSVSTDDFWKGTVPQNEWVYFSRENSEINQILQFFSQSLKDSIEEIYIFASENRILLLADTESFSFNKDSLKTDFFRLETTISDITSESTENTISIDYSASLEDMFSNAEKLSEDLLTKIRNALKSEIYFRVNSFLNTEQKLSGLTSTSFSVSFNNSGIPSGNSFALFAGYILKPVFSESYYLIKNAD